MTEVGTGKSGWSGAQLDGGVVSASVNLPLHRKVQKFSSGTGPGKRAVKRLCCGITK